LLSNVRRSTLLLAVIGESWSRAEALHHEEDWVRREILEALDCGIHVVPVLEGRRTERLRAAELPPELSELAERQSLRLDLHDAETGLRRIGDQIAELVPSLKQADRFSRPAAEPGAVHNSIGTTHGTAVQARDITGDVGTVVKGTQGPVHTGTGNIHQPHYYGNHNQFSGDGATYIAGENRGGIRNHFGGSGMPEDDVR
jgi:hypothetical protein